MAVPPDAFGSVPPLTAPMPRFLQNALGALGLPRPGDAAAPAGPQLAGAIVPSSGVGLPPPGTPFWLRPDVAEKVLLAVAQLEAERATLATQAAESMSSERALAQQVQELKARVWARPGRHRPRAGPATCNPGPLTPLGPLSRAVNPLGRRR